MVTTESRDVEVDADILGQVEQARQSFNGFLIDLAGSTHVGVRLEMNANDIRAERFHLAEVFRDRFPVRVPEFFHEAAGGVVRVVEPPRNERFARVSQDETRAVIT